MREYLQEKWDKSKEVCQPNDILPIAIGQMENENEMAKRANRVLFLDTDLLELKVYSEAYYNEFSDLLLHKHALNNWYDLYFLTNIDAPWVKDDLRDKPDDREGMFLRFKSALENNDRPFVELSGDEEQRFKKAVSIIDELLKK
jgi:nicotinamide riboside kinase